MNIQSHLDRILLHHVEGFPQECWDDIWAAIKAMQIPDTQSERFHLYSCALTLAAYLLTKLSSPPVIGSQSPNTLPVDAPAFCDTMAANLKIQEPLQGVVKDMLKDMLVKRALAMVLTYAISIAEDSEKVQEIFEAVTAWIREKLK